MRYYAIAFDTGGTVLDWHGSLVDELAQMTRWQGISFELHQFANDWRRRTMKGIVGQVRPVFNMDDVHLLALDETMREFGLPAGWRQLGWPVDDNYLGRFQTGTGPVREAGVNVSQSSTTKVRVARQKDHGPPSEEVQAPPPEAQSNGCRRQGWHQRT